MNVYLTRTPKFVQKMFPGFTWTMNKHDRAVYLTFDDGPIPEVTPFVLDVLKAYNAKATFFCVGENIEKHQTLYNNILMQGHSIGSHTYNHLSGWNTENLPYFLNIRKGAKMVHSNLFRPPYGKIKPSQAKFLQRHYEVVMWDILSGDFDPSVSADTCVNNVVNNVVNGSIIVFHDNIKSKEKLEYALPKVLDYLSSEGYEMRAINRQNAHVRHIA